MNEIDDRLMRMVGFIIALCVSFVQLAMDNVFSYFYYAAILLDPYIQIIR